MGFRLKWVVLALLAFVAGQPERCLGELPKVRIGLLRGSEGVCFSGPAGVTIQGLGGDVVAWAAPREQWTLSGDGSGLRLVDAKRSQELKIATGAVLLPPEGGVVTLHGVTGHWDRVTDRDYRGVVEVRREAGGGLAAINVIDIETYLRGVVPSEMPARYPLEALKAQAVAARGQSLIKAGRHRKDGFDLCATEHCQMYGGATSEDARSDQAVALTWGEVLEYEGRLVDTLYSSTCGGHTAANEDYWPDQRPVPYLRGRADYDEEAVQLRFPLSEDAVKEYLKYGPPVNCNQPEFGKSSTFRWWSVVRREELEQSLESMLGDFGELLDVRVTERADSGVVQEIAVVGTDALHKIRGGSAVRRALGGLNSASFAIQAIREHDELPVAFAIWGAGWGHQVGMCQVGAAGLADKGWDYRGILSNYYQGCSTVRRY